MNAEYDRYCQLTTTQQQIRVLRLSGQQCESQFGEAIVCSLEAVSLLDANPFYALSYVWGAPEPSCPLMLDGRIFFIRKNLWMFLQSLRQRFCSAANGSDDGNTIRLWADSICINQNDLAERNHQVSIMGLIYKAADSVYAWLGDSASEHDDGMRCIEEIKQMRAQNRPWIQLEREHRSAPARLANIASASYWHRLWIKQEVLLAKDVWLFFGRDSTHWKDLLFAATLSKEQKAKKSLQDRRSPVKLSQDTQTPQEAMLALLRARASADTHGSLPELVQRFRKAHCQDPKDKIYALLWLVDDGTREAIQVDYTTPVFQTLLETYPLWTLDEDSKPTQHSISQSPLLQYSAFCSQMARLLPPSELFGLFSSKKLRHEVSACGVFISENLVEIVSVRNLATFDCDNVYPAPSSQGQCWLAAVTTRATAVSKTSRSRECFIYSRGKLLAGDHLARVGTTVFVLRKSSPGDYVTTFGAEMVVRTPYSSHSDLLRSQYLEHPCKWARQQLDDCTFRVAHDVHKAPRTPDNIAISCNSAMMVTLLLASNEYHLPSVESRCDSTAEDRRHTAPDDEMMELWCPYIFGVQNKLLDSCISCRTMGKQYTKMAPKPVVPDTPQCACIWRSEPTNEVSEQGYDLCDGV